MTLKAEMVPVGAVLIDTDTKLTPQLCRMLAAATDDKGRSLGIRGVVRYLSFTAPWAQDLDGSEVAHITAENLGLIAVQHAHAPGWAPNPTMGNVDGTAAASNALRAGLPHGTTVCLDLEGVNTIALGADVIGYCQQWWSAVTRSGFDAMLYVGYECGLTGAQLYHQLPFQLYWKSFSDAPTPLPRGFAMWQIQGTAGSGTSILNGALTVDFNIVGRDYQGSGPHWAVTA